MIDRSLFAGPPICVVGNINRDVKVLEVTNGTESRIRIQITDIDCLKNNAKDNTIKINTIVIAECHKDQTVFKTPEGVLLSEEAQKLYRMAFTVSDGEHTVRVELDPESQFVRFSSGGTIYTQTIWVGPNNSSNNDGILIGLFVLLLFVTYLVYKRPAKRRKK